MSSYTNLKTDVECGWSDEVGASITQCAKGVAVMQGQACSELMGTVNEAESYAKNIKSYVSQIDKIRALVVRK